MCVGGPPDTAASNPLLIGLLLRFPGSSLSRRFLDEAKAKGFIREILDACQKHELWKIFADIRKIKGPIPNIARFELAKFLAAEQTVPVRMAVFKSAGQVSDDRFFEDVAVNRGVMVRVSTNLKELVKWLEIELPNKGPAGDHQSGGA